MDQPVKNMSVVHERMKRWKAVQNFREMWRWMAATGIKEKRLVFKSDYIKKKGYKRLLTSNNCFLCNYVIETEGRIKCEKCPVLWSENPFMWIRCCENDSPFLEWDELIGRFKNNIGDVIRLAFLCYKISCLPETERSVYKWN